MIRHTKPVKRHPVPFWTLKLNLRGEIEVHIRPAEVKGKKKTGNTILRRTQSNGKPVTINTQIIKKSAASLTPSECPYQSQAKQKLYFHMLFFQAFADILYFVRRLETSLIGNSNMLNKNTFSHSICLSSTCKCTTKSKLNKLDINDYKIWIQCIYWDSGTIFTC